MKINAPTMSSEDQKLLISTAQDLCGDDNIVCIIGYGSFFTNRVKEHSDIDILVLSKLNVYEKKIVTGTRDIEIFHIGYKRFLQMLKSFNECYVPALLDAVFIYDPLQMQTDLTALAQFQFDKGSPGFDDIVLQRQSYAKLHTVMLDIRSSEVNSSQRMVLWGQFTFVFYRLLCLKNRVWRTSENKIMSHMHDIAPSLAELLDNAMTETNTKATPHMDKLFSEVKQTFVKLEQCIDDAIPMGTAAHMAP